ncbi:MAG: TetR family transcriptional regulator [Gemmatimonadaceae bacterium]|nr:TetR family transcriptional regulator [Acetobacteraceae bacterium]
MTGDVKRSRFDKAQTRQDILDAAREEFAEHGLAGARVEAIAARTRTVKRMIYYYFGSKEGLYLAVLEQAYAGIRTAEQGLDLLSLGPVEAIDRLVEFTFDYQDANPGFVRLVSIENTHNGTHMARSKAIRALNSPVVEMLAGILDEGKRAGVFRADADAVDVHMLISAFCFFRVSNRHTFGLLFGRDLSDPALRERHKRLITDAVLRALEPRDDDGAARQDAA